MQSGSGEQLVIRLYKASTRSFTRYNGLMESTTIGRCWESVVDGRSEALWVETRASSMGMEERGSMGGIYQDLGL